MKMFLNRGLSSPFRLNLGLARPRTSLRRQRTVRANITSLPGNISTEQYQKLEAFFAQATQQSKAAGGAGGDTSFEGLLRVNSSWEALKSMRTGADAGPVPVFVNDTHNRPGPFEAIEYDVVVCGGTLGIFTATALQKKGLKVAVVERGPLTGRDQEWNISRAELQPLLEFGILEPGQLEDCVMSEWNPCRCGFFGAKEEDYVIVENVLNVGVSPRKLIETVTANFKQAGGSVFENCSIDGVDVYSDCAAVVHRKRENSGDDRFGPGERQTLSTRLVVDCMGHNSPIVRQLRWGVKPDGVCLVVGGLARGFTNNKTSDVIFTDENSSRAKNLQTFWEAFPAGSGPTDRTTYMFTYLDADPRRISLLDFFCDYLEAMPRYQRVRLEDLQFLRLLYGFFPTYRQSPLQSGFDRVVQIGDASGIQSPLSFGGFGALLRHLPRLVPGISEAVESRSLDKASLSLLNPYLPNLASSWLFQHSMSIRVGQNKPSDFINRVMASNFKNMKALGPSVMMPFLQDVVQFGSLGSILARQIVTEPLFVPVILSQLEPAVFLDWIGHFGNMALLQVLHSTVGPVVRSYASGLETSNPTRYKLNRMAEAWEYGSGMDYELH